MAKNAPIPVALDALPVLPLRDVVVYPHMVIPLFVGRDKSMRALERAMEGERQILLVAQKSPDIDDPEIADLHQVGTLAGVLQLLKLPDGTVKVLVEGQSRVAVEDFHDEGGMLTARSRADRAGLQREGARARRGIAHADLVVRTTGQAEPQAAAGSAGQPVGHR